MSNMDPTDIAKVIADAVRGQVGVLAAELNETVEVVDARIGQLDERVRELDERVREVAGMVNRQAAWIGGMRDGLDARISGLERKAADTDEYRAWIRDEAVRLGIVKAKKKIAD